jgi:hypothetical protein
VHVLADVFCFIGVVLWELYINMSCGGCPGGLGWISGLRLLQKMDIRIEVNNSLQIV